MVIKKMNIKPITVYDIAKESGVSPATVSRVLTNSAKVSEEKKKRVEEIIKKYDFEPNGLARSLSKQESKTIGMIVPDIRNPFYSNICVECEIAAARLGYNMILCNTINKLESESGHLKTLSEKRVDAIIQVGGSVDEASPDREYINLVNKIAKKLPVVAGGDLEGADCYRVLPEPDYGMKELSEYLIGLGHKEIAIIGGWNTALPTVKKRSALERILGEHKLVLKKEYVIDCDYSIEGGYEGTKQLFNLPALPTAIIAINEFCAMGILKALEEKGVKVPEKVSIIAYDDTYFSEIMSPPLTAMNYNLKDFAEQIMNTIIKVISHEKFEKKIFINPFLTIRQSCSRHFS